MRRLIGTNTFAIAFFVSYATFFGVTIFLMGGREHDSFVGWTSFGFPFEYYFQGCWSEGYVWTGLLGNAVAGALSSFAFGCLATMLPPRILAVWTYFRSSEFRKKWYL